MTLTEYPTQKKKLLKGARNNVRHWHTLKSNNTQVEDLTVQAICKKVTQKNGAELHP